MSVTDWDCEYKIMSDIRFQTLVWMQTLKKYKLSDINVITLCVVKNRRDRCIGLNECICFVRMSWT